jgi:putative transposase
MPAAHPERKSLPHGIPSWVQPGTVYFITICGKPKGRDQFCRSAVTPKIMESVKVYHDRLVWHAHLVVLMPDHIHGLFSFPPDRSIGQVLSSWKGYLAKVCGIEWQRDFFEHRLRDAASMEEKAFYIRANPVRAGLADKPEDWPHVWPA